MNESSVLDYGKDLDLSLTWARPVSDLEHIWETEAGKVYLSHRHLSHLHPTDGLCPLCSFVESAPLSVKLINELAIRAKTSRLAKTRLRAMLAEKRPKNNAEFEAFRLLERVVDGSYDVVAANIPNGRAFGRERKGHRRRR